jgi:hypothetical protein
MVHMVCVPANKIIFLLLQGGWLNESIAFKKPPVSEKSSDKKGFLKVMGVVGGTGCGR